MAQNYPGTGHINNFEYQNMGNQNNTNMMGGNNILPCNSCGAKAGWFHEEQLSFNGILLMVVLFVVYCPLFWLPLIMESMYEEVEICRRCAHRVKASDRAYR